VVEDRGDSDWRTRDYPSLRCAADWLALLAKNLNYLAVISKRTLRVLVPTVRNKKTAMKGGGFWRPV